MQPPRVIVKEKVLKKGNTAKVVRRKKTPEKRPKKKPVAKSTESQTDPIELTPQKEATQANQTPKKDADSDT